MITEQCQSWINTSKRASTTLQLKKQTSSRDARLRGNSTKWNVCRLQAGDDRLLPSWMMKSLTRVTKKEE